MKNILDIVKNALKGDSDTEIYIPLCRNSINNKLQSNITRISINQVETSNKQIELAQKTDPIINDTNQSDPVSCENTIPDTKVNLNQKKTVAEDQCHWQSVLQSLNILEEMTKKTDILKVFNRFESELEKRNLTLLKQDDQQRIINKRNILSCKQPTPLNDDVIITNRFPYHVLPKKFQDLVKSHSHALSVPIEAVIPALLGAIFIAGRGQFKIQVKPDYFESFTEYFIVVQHSGENKSAIVRSFRSVFNNFVSELQKVYDINLPNQQLSLEAIKLSKKKLLKVQVKDFDASNPITLNEKLSQIRQFADSLAPLEKEIKKFIHRPNFFNDTPTLKKLAENMEQQNEVLAIFEAEPGIWKHRVKSNEDTILLKGYTMEPFGDETSTNGSVTMESPVLTICSYIQPREAGKIFSKEDLQDDGLLPRILPVFIPRNENVKDADPLDVPPDLIEMYEVKIKSLLQHALPVNSDETKRQIYTLNLTEEAYTIFVDYKQTINNQLIDGRFKNCEAFGSKLAGHAVRLAGAIHFLQHDEPWDELIDSSAMKAGIAIADFFADHAKSIFDNERLESIRYAKKILKKIKEKRLRPLFNQRDAQRVVGHCTATQINLGLNLLESHHYLIAETNSLNQTIFIVNQRIINGGFGNIPWSNQLFD